MTSPQVVKVDNLDGFIKWLRTAEARPIEHLRALGADDGYIERARRGKAGLVPGVTTSFTDASGKRRVIVPSQKNIAAGQVLFMVQTILDELAEPEIVRDKPWQMPLWTISMEHARLTFFNEELAREFRNDHNRKIGARNSGRRSPVTEVLQAILRNSPEAILGR